MHMFDQTNRTDRSCWTKGGFNKSKYLAQKSTPKARIQGQHWRRLPPWAPLLPLSLCGPGVTLQAGSQRHQVRDQKNTNVIVSNKNSTPRMNQQTKSYDLKQTSNPKRWIQETTEATSNRNPPPSVDPTNQKNRPCTETRLKKEQHNGWVSGTGSGGCFLV